eukprot:27597_1
MSFLIYFILICFRIDIIFGSKYYSESCGRHRRPFHLLTIEERMIYAEGFQKLRENGVLDKLGRVHSIEAHKGTVDGSNFLYWHTYLIWELETQIRNLGDKFECFSLPYWDFTYDSGDEADPFIFNTVFGGDGDPERGYNVNDEIWKIPNYWVAHHDLCDDVEKFPFCGLKREISHTQLIPTTAEIAMAIIENPSFKDYSREMTMYHGSIHMYFGANTKVPMHSGWAAEDPIFFVLHSYLDYLRALWASCWNYDRINKNDLNIDHNIFSVYCDEYGIWVQHQPNDPTDKWMNSVCGAIGWDDTFNYYPLDQNEWALCSKMEIKLKDTFNLKDWGISYELGTFYENSRINEFCENNHPQFLDKNEWFIETDKMDNKLLDIAIEQQSDTQNYIDLLWKDLNDEKKK